MEFQGKKATHDFLSLYTKDSSFQLQDSRPPSQGFCLRTHDFLKPLEKSKEPEPDQLPGPTDRAAGVAHVLPGGIGTYSITHVAENGSSIVVKPEVVPCARAPGLASKPEPDSGFGPYAGVAFALWDSSSSASAMDRDQWRSTFATCPTASFSSRDHPVQDKKRLMESGSRTSRGFDEEDEDDDEFGKREGTSKKVELTVRVDVKGENEQKPTTPRSKHSATEQRRRSKINDRFQILRELIPHSDQKRDKASFLLEVIEYIRFLQEKVQKCESSYPGWSEENTKIMPWVKVYFRSFWKNARDNNQVPRDGIADPSQSIKNVQAPGLMYSIDDNRVTESAMSADVPYKPMENPIGFSIKASSAPSCASSERRIGVAQPQPRLISDIDNMASRSQSQWLRPSGPADCSVESEMLNDHEELMVDEGTINISTAYSQNILNTLNHALESSGLDLSEANISVQINLGKRATRTRVTTTTMSSAKDLDDPLSKNRPAIGHSRVGSSGEVFEQSPKRRRSDDS